MSKKKLKTNGETARLRLLKDWSQERLAQNADVGLRVVTEIESGRGASPEYIQRVGAALGLDLDKAIPTLTVAADHDAFPPTNQRVWEIRIVAYGDSSRVNDNNRQQIISGIASQLPPNAEMTYRTFSNGSIVFIFEADESAFLATIDAFCRHSFDSLAIFRLQFPTTRFPIGLGEKVLQTVKRTFPLPRNLLSRARRVRRTVNDVQKHDYQGTLINLLWRSGWSEFRGDELDAEECSPSTAIISLCASKLSYDWSLTLPLNPTILKASERLFGRGDSWPWYLFHKEEPQDGPANSGN